MSTRVQLAQMRKYACGNLSLAPDFSPVIAESRWWKPFQFKRLIAFGRAGTRLKPRVNEK